MARTAQQIEAELRALDTMLKSINTSMQRLQATAGTTQNFQLAQRANRDLVLLNQEAITTTRSIEVLNRELAKASGANRIAGGHPQQAPLGASPIASAI